MRFVYSWLSNWLCSWEMVFSNRLGCPRTTSTLFKIPRRVVTAWTSSDSILIIFCIWFVHNSEWVYTTWIFLEYLDCIPTYSGVGIARIQIHLMLNSISNIFQGLRNYKLVYRHLYVPPYSWSSVHEYPTVGPITLPIHIGNPPPITTALIQRLNTQRGPIIVHCPFSLNCQFKVNYFPSFSPHRYQHGCNSQNDLTRRDPGQRRQWCHPIPWNQIRDS